MRGIVLGARMALHSKQEKPEENQLCLSVRITIKGQKFDMGNSNQ